MDKLKAVTFLSSVRPDRMADRVYKYVHSVLVENEFSVNVLDPLHEKLDILDVPYHFYSSHMDIPEKLRKIYKIIDEADVYIIISTEYNWTIPPALTNLIDYFPPSVFKFKPVGIITYSQGNGGFGSATHIIQMMTSLGCMVQPMIVNISMVQDVIDSKSVTDNVELKSSLGILCEQLTFSGLAFKNHKIQHKTPSVNLFFD